MSVVGDVIGQGKPRIVLTPVRCEILRHPDLPGSRSEMVLPLRVRGETIGALDVQSTDADAFDEQDLTILQTLTDQIALAIANIRLFENSRSGWKRSGGPMAD
jgi:GAF domain-containing protein